MGGGCKPRPKGKGIKRKQVGASQKGGREKKSTNTGGKEKIQRRKIHTEGADIRKKTSKGSKECWNGKGKMDV